MADDREPEPSLRIFPPPAPSTQPVCCPWCQRPIRVVVVEPVEPESEGQDSDEPDKPA